MYDMWEVNYEGNGLVNYLHVIFMRMLGMEFFSPVGADILAPNCNRPCAGIFMATQWILFLQNCFYYHGFQVPFCWPESWTKMENWVSSELWAVDVIIGRWTDYGIMYIGCKLIGNHHGVIGCLILSIYFITYSDRSGGSVFKQHQSPGSI